MLPRFSVKRPYTVVVGIVLIIILGYVSFTSMQTDLLPDMTLPYAIVYTTYPGASPEEVETIVTRPVEQSMATISNIENVSSVSSENISMVILEFSQSANMDAVTIEMRENLDQIEGYWDDSVGSPIIMKLNPDMLPVMVAALEAGDMNQSDLTDLVNNEILPELESIEGVASVSTSGTIEEQVQVTLREDKIKEANRKIRDALEKKFDEAESELEEAQDEVESGKQQLENGQNQLIDQTSEADSKLNTGNYQMITGAAQIDQNLAKVESGLAQLSTAEQELNAKEQEIQAGKEQLLALPGQKAQAEAGLAQLSDGISQLENAPTNLAYIEGILAAYQAQYQLVLDAIGQLTETPQPGEAEQPAETVTPADGNPSVELEQPEEGNESAEAGQPAGTEAPSDQGQETVPESEAPVQEAVPQPEVQVQEAAPEPEVQIQAETSAAVPVETEVTQTAQEENAVDAAVKAALETLDKTFAEMVAEDPEFKAAIEQIKMITDLEILAGQLEEWTLKKVEAQTALAYLGVDLSKTGQALINSIDTAKGNLVAQRVQLQGNITQLDQAIEASSGQMATLEAGLEGINKGRTELAAQRTQLETAKAQLDGAKEKISSGQSTVSAAVGELNKAKITTTIEMAVGKVELNSGQKEIDAALEEIEKQKDAAMEQADVTKIITADMIKGILAAQNFSMPAGYVTEDGIDFLVRVGNKLEDTKGIEDLVILDMHMDDLEPVRLSDVADVVILDNSDKVYAKINGNPGVVFSMQKQSGYSTGEVSDKIKKKFAELEEINGNIHIVSLMDQGIYIDLVVDSVIQNMLSGAGLAIIVLLLFLKSIGSTFVIACSIPISIMTAIVLMYFSGITLNIISLSGLALGIGMLVDNSIVVIENIYRMRGEGVSSKKAAVEGAKQVSGAIAASTLTTICVFAPIVFTEGITRQLFVDMGLTIAYSLLASLVIALTLVPMMGAGLLKNSREKKARIFNAIQNAYAKLLGWSLKIKFLVLLLAVGLLVVSAKLAVSKGTAFMPEMESTQVSVTLNMPEGSTLAETGEMSDKVMERIMAIQDVTDVGAMAAGNTMASLMGGNQEASAEQVSIYVLLSEEKTITNDELVKEILTKTEDLGCDLNVETSTMDMSALGGTGISIKIKGRELDKLKEMASEVAEILSGVEGTQNISDGIEEKTLEMRLVVDKDKAMSYQLTTAQVYQFLQQKLADASTATTLSTLSKDYPVLVVSDTDETLTRDKIKKLTITGKDEESKDVEVPIAELVEFQNTEGFSSINREAQTRYVTVTAEIDSDHNIGLVSSDVEDALKDYEVPKGYSLEMAGEDETINEAMGEVLKMLLLAVAFMYLIMVAQFQSLLSPFIVMFTIPLAFTGGFIGLYLTDSPVSVIALIGFVMLSGIIVNNGIVLVDYTNQLRREGMEKKAALVEAGRTRLRPVIMTALTTILGLLPMAVGMGMGADMVQPMAIVTVGGLVYGTLLTLFVVPCIYDILNRKKDMTEEEI
ncbi:MAG: efflux RND transporter permease subunit [Eubacteriales bacterium]|nr:efflux RND transporter permease subunit [Eubacteriales bacterium]